MRTLAPASFFLCYPPGPVGSDPTCPVEWLAMNEKWTKSSLPLLFLCMILALWACAPGSSKPDISNEEEAAGEAEAERTRKMEEKAAEIERMAEEIRTMEGSDQDKIDAVNRLEEARRELSAMEEEGDEP